jgi:hypothetical protein
MSPHCQLTITVVCDQTALSFVAQLKAYSFAGRILLVTAGLPDSDALELIRLGISGIFTSRTRRRICRPAFTRSPRAAS